MARHFVAVCVVCLLCADRLPCQQHIDSIFPDEVINTETSQNHLNAKVFRRSDFQHINPSTQSTDNVLNRDGSFNLDSNNQQINNKFTKDKARRKRHANHGHDHEDQHPTITSTFLQRIVDEHGNEGDGETLTTIDFQALLRKLQLHLLVDGKPMKNSSNETCISDKKLVHLIQPQLHDHHEHDKPQNKPSCRFDTSDFGLLSNCGKATQQLVEYPQNYTLHKTDILNLCPVLLYQLSSQQESMRSGCILSEHVAEHDIHDSTQGKRQKEVWIYAFISVFACSILGLVGVAIIPFMDSRYYKHIIQFLVSLAVGTMTGDALLHLLPHSLAGQTEQNMILKGLTCMGGIIFFYATEHGLTMISEWRKTVAKRESKNPSRAKVVRDPESSMNNSGDPGDKLCKSKYSSYPYCYDEIAMGTKNDMHLPNVRKLTESGDIVNVVDRKRNGIIMESNLSEGAAQSLLSTSQNNYAPIAELNHHNHQLNYNNQHNQLNHQDRQVECVTEFDGISTGGGGGDGPGANGCAEAPGKEVVPVVDAVTVILREHESSHHGHSHKHGHVHSPPESLSAVAWMIIMGDGLHNFTDGMAIGAAFAENIAGGFSTSLAVFCHELPHELGDFAILLKAGMSVKSAVYYNLLTGVLSFIGMIFGIIFGQSQDSAQWMFAAAAGLFIYIALVDMMPELSSAHKSVQQFFLQLTGMISGVLIMLLIAIFEGDLMTVFSSESHQQPAH